MKKDTSKLIARIRKEDNAAKAYRLARLKKAIARHGSKFLDHELYSIEQALNPVIGRIEMDRA